MASLCRARGFGSDAIRFHKEDPRTTHTSCPGRSVRKEWVVEAVRRAMAPDAVPPAKLVVYRQGMGDQPAAVIPVEMRGGASYASSAAMSAATGIPADGDAMVAVRSFLGARYALKWVAASRKVFAVET